MKKMYVIGIGPGNLVEMSIRAADIIKECNVIVGYKTYIDLVAPMIEGKDIIQNGMRSEIERVKLAISAAEDDKNKVAIISSGDSGIYGMAGLAYKLCEGKDIEIEVIPGITAASAAASVLGAPLMHDYCSISLSDLLTPYELIEKRVKLAAAGDFVIALYNPRSRGRESYLQNMIDIIKQSRGEDTPVSLVKSALRDGQEVHVSTLGEFDCTLADMRSIVIIGNSNTYVKDGKMITPRGYERKL
jgi:precorrin-3B C17-methyltransferase